MKLFKKMVALVAVAACCFTMTAPVSASAASFENCDHRFRLTQMQIPYGTAYHRDITYAVDYDRDGIKEYIEDICSEQTWLIYEVTVCDNCSIVYSVILKDSYVRHSEPLYCPES